MSPGHRVYVVGLDRQARESVGECLASTGMEVWPFTSGESFLAILDHLPPSCVLIDMDMTGTPGLELMEEMVRRGVCWPIIAVTAGGELPIAVRAMKLGALDFIRMPLSRDVLAPVLLPALEALEGMDEAKEESREAKERLGRLTAREREVFRALLDGKPNKTVARDLSISVRTVEMHRANLMCKLRVKSLAKAAIMASRCGTLAQFGPTEEGAVYRETRLPLSAMRA